MYRQCDLSGTLQKNRSSVKNKMFYYTGFQIATFTAPIQIGTAPGMFVWLLPLLLAIAVVYKALKLPNISALNFIKETTAVFCTILIVMVLIAAALHVITWIVT